ncbi:MAG: exodeoxyribonuclease VII small subunit [Gammaproteobacteria bacterium]|nr:exodeoxyribonuclease VII small subunit [Gammaproteobacteria bacterium]
MTSEKNTSFETTIAELEQIVSQLESGDLELEQSLKLFERGIELTRLSQSKLQDAEQKVKILMDKQGELTLEPFVEPQPTQSNDY